MRRVLFCLLLFICTTHFSFSQIHQEKSHNDLMKLLQVAQIEEGEVSVYHELFVAGGESEKNCVVCGHVYKVMEGGVLISNRKEPKEDKRTELTYVPFDRIIRVKLEVVPKNLKGLGNK